MRLALVTGAASGLGRATAVRLAREGLQIAAADLDDAANRSVVDSLPGEGHRSYVLDVADERSVIRLFEDVERDCSAVTALLHFAGIYSSRAASGRISLLDSEQDEWDQVVAINARGSFFCLREMARRRVQRPVEHGRIVLLSSVAGQMGGLQGSIAYAASKGAVLAMAKSAARELAPHGVTVNVIAPGPIDTPMMRRSIPDDQASRGYSSVSAIPLGRVGEADEVAAAASYLVSIEAAFVTGATLDVNGGFLMR